MKLPCITCQMLCLHINHDRSQTEDSAAEQVEQVRFFFNVESIGANLTILQVFHGLEKCLQQIDTYLQLSALFYFFR